MDDRDFPSSPDRRGAESASPRPLHRGHFAFMRAVVQGLDPRESWGRYLQGAEGEAGDRRRLRAAIARMRDEFAAAARREARHGLARLVLIDADRLREDAAGLPTLEAFAAAQGLEDFPHAEQLAAYEAVHGRAGRRQGRRARVIAQQLQALRWLENLVVRPPAAGDAPSRWLNPAQAARLEAAGLRTLGDVAARIAAQGLQDWTRGLPGLGAVKGRRIVEWLRHHEGAIGVALPGEPVRTPAAVAAPASPLRPLEALQPPAALQGQAGADLAAVQAWLQAHAGSSAHTLRAYRKEAERWLLWSWFERGRPLRALTAADSAAYLEFLADPPRQRWCAPRSRRRASRSWRPLEGPLSQGARRQAATILRALSAFLVQQGHLERNPWPAGAFMPAAPALDARRSLGVCHWQRVAQALDEGQRDAARRTRLRLALALLQGAGLRVSELLGARVGDLQLPTPSAGAWQLRVRGRRGRTREVPLPEAALPWLRAHLTARGLQPPGVEQDDAALLGRLRGDRRRAIAQPTLHGELKALLTGCVPQRANDALSRASPHWLRHTHALQALAAGETVAAVCRRLGHASRGPGRAYRRALVGGSGG